MPGLCFGNRPALPVFIVPSDAHYADQGNQNFVLGVFEQISVTERCLEYIYLFQKAAAEGSGRLWNGCARWEL